MDLYDVGAERAVLAGLLQYGAESYVEIMDILAVDSFGDVNNQTLYRCLGHILDKDMKVDIPSILSAAEHLDLAESINTEQELNYIKSLSSFHVEKDNVFTFATQIKKYEFARTIKSIIKGVDSRLDNLKGSESIDDIISMLEEPVNNFIMQDTGEKKMDNIGDGIDEYIDYLIENKCDIVGLPSGFPIWDAAIGGGLRRKCVDLVTARSKGGKSLFGIEAGLNLARQGIPVLIIDTEMGKEDQLNRILANMAGIPINDIGTAKFTEFEGKEAELRTASAELKGLPLVHVSVAGESFESILNTIKRFVMHRVGQDEDGNTNDCLIVYDYLKMMSANSMSAQLQEYQALGFQITSLHNLCVKLDIPCLAFAQLNRDGITAEHEGAISGSDRLIWLCTSFSIFKGKSDEEISEDGVRNGNKKLIPILARHGPGLSSGDYINIRMIGECAKLKELSTRNQIKSQADPDLGMITKEELENIDLDDE